MRNYNYRIDNSLFLKFIEGYSINFYTEYINEDGSIYLDSINSTTFAQEIIINIRGYNSDASELYSEHIKKVIQTDLFMYFYGFNQFNNKIQKVLDFPKIDFLCGDFLDDTNILNFDSPETLDEQLAKIYGLTKEEQELMKNSIKPWKEVLSLTADGSC